MYEPLEPVVDMLRAAEPHRSVAPGVGRQRADVENSFRNADHVLRDQFSIHRHEPGQLELLSAAVLPRLAHAI
jgi:CO/xanthine dehydrogenase Mo-binding subunit